MATPTSWATTGPKQHNIFANLTGVMHDKPRFFDRTYYQLEFPTGSGNYYALPGLVLALNTVTDKYVPYVSDASHGTGSDAAVGVLPELLELSTWDRVCAPVYHGELVEQYCYTEEGAIGVISSAIKTALADIKWK